MAPVKRLEFIANRLRRLATYRKRKKTLKKAAYELSTLCGIPTAVICIAPNGEPDTWPEDEGALRDIIGRLPSLGAEKRSERRFDSPGYVAAQVSQTMSGQDRDLPSLDLGLEAVAKQQIELLKENSRCNQGDFHGDTGGEQQQVKGVAADACLLCSSTASRDFNYEQKDPAFSMPLLFMPSTSTGVTFLLRESQFVKGGGDEGNANAQ